MPRNRQTKAKHEPLYVTTSRSLSRGRERLAKAVRDFWHDLTLARGSRYYRALAVFCVICMVIGMGGSLLWRSTALRTAMDRYRAVFLGRGTAPAAESPPLGPASETAATTPAAPGAPAGKDARPPGTGTAASGPGPAGPEVSEPPPPPPRPDLTTMLRPVTGPVLLGYGWQFSTTLNDWRYHAAVDLQAPEGTAVRAALAGRVAVVGDSFDLGLYVILDHGGGIRTVYGSLKSVTVKTGQAVARGQELGKAGTSAETESQSGPHVHFELLDGGEPLDPTPYLH